MNDIKNSAEVLIVMRNTEGPLCESFDAKFDRLNDPNINHKTQQKKFLKLNGKSIRRAEKTKKF